MIIPKLAFFIILEGGIAIIGVGIIKGLLNLAPPIDAWLIIGIGFWFCFSGITSLMRSNTN